MASHASTLPGWARRVLTKPPLYEPVPENDQLIDRVACALLQYLQTAFDYADWVAGSLHGTRMEIQKALSHMQKTVNLMNLKT